MCTPAVIGWNDPWQHRCSRLKMVRSMQALFLSSSALLALLLVTTGAERVVWTKNGPVQGVTVSADDEVTVEAYLGIPYAEPPVGRLRFGRPVPKTHWSGVLDASKLPPACVQNATLEKVVPREYYTPVTDVMSEDCLQLSLWVPYSKKISTLKPVIVFFHGGGFYQGSSNMRQDNNIYDGTRLSRFGDVIVAMVNYRVGAMGFFAGFVESAEGNMGIYDLLMASKWIKDNAKAFGGDPDHLVLMGESAGSMIIGGFMTSPMTQGLFKRVIMESGSSVQTMILDDNARLYYTSQRYAEILGCANAKKNITLKSNPRQVISCLRGQSPTRLIEAEGVLLKGNPVSFYPRTGDEFVPEPSIFNFSKGEFFDTEMLLGINEEEGNLFLTISAPEYFGLYGQGNSQSISRRLARNILGFIFKKTEQAPKSKEIADFYMGLLPKNATSDQNTKTMGLSLGDYMIVCNSFFTAEYYSVRNPVYFYLNKRRPSSSPLAPWMGATHFDELQYVFGNPLFDNFTEQEEQFSQRIMKRWMTFAKTGNPNIEGEVEWPLFTRENPAYLILDDEESTGIRPDDHRCEFWRDKYRAYIPESKPIAQLQTASGFTVMPHVVTVITAILVVVSSTKVIGC